MNSSSDLIRAEILQRGAIPFARFMELALYAPGHGYYERQKQVGCRGDFYTSVSVGPLFGRLLASYFADAFQTSKSEKSGQGSPAASSSFCILECGAHDGTLAADLLKALEMHHPEIFARLAYLILEPSPARREWQQARLAGFNQVHWINDWSAVSEFKGIIFSNELFDAFPVHVLRWNAQGRHWNQMMVGLKGEKFSWITDSARYVKGPDVPPELAAVLPDGFLTEICPGAVEWWQQAAGRLVEGKVMAIDYGLTAGEFLLPERSRGTLRAYSQHQVSNDVLAQPGEQDLTAHVNFTALIEAGEGAGLRTTVFQRQSAFLTAIVGKMAATGELAWLPRDTRQFQTLTHPEHLGHSFRVLVQER